MICVLDNRRRSNTKEQWTWPVTLMHARVMNSRSGTTAAQSALVSIVDDDESVRESLPDLLRVFGFSACAFSSAQEFLASDSITQTKCLILDVAMPGMNGLDLQRELKRRGQTIPVIFITAHKDDAIREQALHEGAVEFLYKPFSDTALLEALRAAVPANGTAG